jgi:hypothetical protein
MLWTGSKFHAVVRMSTDRSLLSTGLALEKARWIPRGSLPVWPDDNRPKTPTTPMSQPDGSSSPAWDPTSETAEVEADPLPAPGQSR